MRTTVYDQGTEDRLDLMQAEIDKVKKRRSSGSILLTMLRYIGIGFAYQVIVWGPAEWTDMTMVAHVTGWWVFLLVALASFAWHIGIWLIPIVVALAIIGYFAHPLYVRYQNKRWSKQIMKKFGVK